MDGFEGFRCLWQSSSMHHRCGPAGGAFPLVTPSEAVLGGEAENEMSEELRFAAVDCKYCTVAA